MGIVAQSIALEASESAHPRWDRAKCPPLDFFVLCFDGWRRAAAALLHVAHARRSVPDGDID